MTYQLGPRIKRLREFKGWTQADLAEACQMSISYVGKLERGDEGYQNPTLETLGVLAKALEVSLEELLPDSLKSSVTTSKKTQSRSIPVLKESEGKQWKNFADLRFPYQQVEERWEAQTEDLDAFYVRIEKSTGEMKKGDLLLVEPNAPLENGCRVLCQDAKGGFLVRLFYQEKNQIRLQSLHLEQAPLYVKGSQKFPLYRVAGKFTRF